MKCIQRRQSLGTFLLLVIILFGGCSGCGQKTVTESPIDAPQTDVKPIDAQQRSDTTAMRPEKSILDVELQPIQLPPNYNPYYGKSYWGITENNLQPPPADEFYGDPLFWIPGWEIRTQHYRNGDGESYSILPSAEYEEKWARIKKRRDGLDRIREQRYENKQDSCFSFALVCAVRGAWAPCPGTLPEY